MRRARYSILGGLLLVALSGCGGQGLTPEVPLVTEVDVERALESTRPQRPSGSDRVEHFASRAERRPDERFALEQEAAARLLRFRGYGDERDLREAEAALDRLIGARGDPAPGWLMMRSSIDLSSHRFGAAIHAAERALELSAGSEGVRQARLRLFDAYFAAGRLEEAQVQLDLSSGEGDFAELVRRARLEDRRGNVEAARDLMATSLGLARAYAQPPVVISWALTELGHFEYHSGDPGAAVARFREALEVLPGSPAALEGLADVAYGEDGDPEAARRLYEAALESGGHLDLHLRLIEIARLQGDGERASRVRTRFIERATASRATERQYRRPLALVLLEDPDRLDDAVQYAEVDLTDRQDAGALAVYGRAMYRLGLSDRGEAALRSALSWGAPSPAVFELAALAALEAGDVEWGRDLAREALEGASELGPWREARLRRAM